MRADQLSDAPLPDDALKARDFAEELTQLLDDARFSWAWDTLGGIRDTVLTRQTVSPKQYIAVRNIRQSVAERERGDGPRWSRRYEGR